MHLKLVDIELSGLCESNVARDARMDFTSHRSWMIIKIDENQP